MFGNKWLKKLRRSRQIIRVFTKYGLDYLFDLGKISILAKLSKKNNNQIHLNSAQKFCRALEELGPAFIKFGQILSTRPDFLPPEFIKELEKLQDQTHPFEGFLAAEIIERELNKPVGELFKEFDKKPVASASLSQVHKAVLHGGDIVAVKVQRPDIRENIELDLAILQDLAGFVENRLHNGWMYRPRLMVDEFRKAIRKELDFTREAHNFEKFRVNFRDTPYIRVPRIYSELTTSLVLTMEFIDGIKISDAVLEEYNSIYNPRKIAQRGAEAILKQIVIDGFFHADPHPANLFVQPPADIIMLDVGMVGSLDRKTTIEGAKLLQAVVNRDADKTMECFSNLKIIIRDVDRDLLRQELTDLFDSYLGIPLKDLDINKTGRDIIGIMTRHNLTLPANLVLMIKALSMIESVGRELYPELDMLSVARPFIRKISGRRIEPKTLLKKSEAFLQESLELIGDMPRDLKVILQKLKEGRLKIVTENQETWKLAESVKKAGIWISLSLLIAAILISSTVIIKLNEPGFAFLSWRTLGTAGFLIAGALIIVIFISIFRSLRE